MMKKTTSISIRPDLVDEKRLGQMLNEFAALGVLNDQNNIVYDDEDKELEKKIHDIFDRFMPTSNNH